MWIFFYLLSYLSCPGVMEYILKGQLWLLDYLDKWQRRTLNYICCLFLSNSINYVCINNLHSDPKITEDELDDVLTMDNMPYFWMFVKIILVSTLVKYFKKSNFFLGRVVKMLYDTGNIIDIPANHKSLVINNQNPRETIAKIINKRRWDYLYDPVILNAIIQIYREGDSNLLGEILFRFRSRTVQVITMWSLSSLFPIPLLASYSAYVIHFQSTSSFQW
jgi:hypothetical protein